MIAAVEEAFATQRWTEVVFCGFGEPTERLDVLLETAKWIRAKSPSVPIRLDTNGHGYALNPDRDVAAELASAGVDRVSVSLNGFDEATYKENCRPKIKKGFGEVLNFIRRAKAERLSVEVSAVRMPEVDVAKIREIAKSLEVAFRVRDYVACFW